MSEATSYGGQRSILKELSSTNSKIPSKRCDTVVVQVKATLAVTKRSTECNASAAKWNEQDELRIHRNRSDRASNAVLSTVAE